MDPILHLVERSSGIIDPTSGSTDMSAHHRHQRRIPALISTRPRRGQTVSDSNAVDSLSHHLASRLLSAPPPPPPVRSERDSWRTSTRRMSSWSGSTRPRSGWPPRSRRWSRSCCRAGVGPSPIPPTSSSASWSSADSASQSRRWGERGESGVLVTVLSAS